jgi:hypothetical protein
LADGLTAPQQDAAKTVEEGRADWLDGASHLLVAESAQTPLLRTRSGNRRPQTHKEAYWLPTVSVREVDLVFKRLGNYQFNPVWGFLADQSWIERRGQGDSSRCGRPSSSSARPPFIVARCVQPVSG